MKKYAFLLMGSAYDTARHQTDFESETGHSSIFTVRSLEEARGLVKRLQADGYGAIELCGAFGEAGCKELIALTNHEIAIGYSVHLPEQDRLFEQFFGN